jgi:hypothetical protein
MRRDCLDSLRVISPCDVPWSSMEGDEAVRFCGKCRKNVYNVAQLPRAEAVALIERAEGRVCMQLTRRADGTIVTGDCWAQLRRARKRGLLALAVAAPAIFAATLWSQAFGLRALFGRSEHRAVERGEPVGLIAGQTRVVPPPPPEPLVTLGAPAPSFPKKPLRRAPHNTIRGRIAAVDDLR